MKLVKNNKLLLKIFSTLIAVVLWFAVTYTEDPSLDENLGGLDAVFLNEDVLAKNGLIIVDKDELPSFSVTIRGRRSKVISSLEKVSASIDVSGITSAGNHEIDVDYIYPADSVMLTKTKYSAVTVTAEKLITREIPVKITSKSNKKNKLYLIKSDSNVETVTISGAQSVVNSIDAAVVSLDESAITTTSTSSYPFSLYDANGNVLEEKNITFKSHSAIAINHTLYNRVELPVNVVLSDDLKNEYSVDVEEQDVLKVYAGLEDGVDVDSLNAVYDREHLKSKEESVTLQIQIPDGVYIPEESKNVTVKCNVSRKSTYDVEVPVSTKNLSTGYTASISPDKIRVRVKCSKEDAKADNISATIDAKNLLRGSRENIIVNVTAKDNMQVVGTYTVRATLN